MFLQLLVLILKIDTFLKVCLEMISRLYLDQRQDRMTITEFPEHTEFLKILTFKGSKNLKSTLHMELQVNDLVSAGNTMQLVFPMVHFLQIV